MNHADPPRIAGQVVGPEAMDELYGVSKWSGEVMNGTL